MIGGPATRVFMINIHRFDLNLLVVLNAIAKEGGITSASRRLNLTQPTVSHALGRLREALDDPLFVREGRRMVPTPVARSILEPVRRSLEAIEASLNQLERFDPANTQRRFRIGLRHAVESLILPRLMGHLRKVAPRVEVIALNHDRSRLQQDLASGVLDVVVDIGLPAMPQVGSSSVLTTALLVVCRDDHPAVQDNTQMDLDTYLSLDHILVSSRRSGPAVEDMALGARELARRVVVRCANPWTALQIVACTDLVATLHVAEMSELLSRLGGVRIFGAPFENVGAPLSMYWCESRQDEPSVAWLRRQMCLCFGLSQNRSDPVSITR